MAKSLVEILISLTLICLCCWLTSGCGANAGNQPVTITKAQAYEAAQEQYWADWHVRQRLSDLEMRPDPDDEGDDDE